MTIVVTDLDESLLEHATYSFEPAREALARLAARGVPVVFCTSKTRGETEHFRHATGNTHPFIVENGGAIYLPRAGFPAPPAEARDAGEYLRIALGTEYGAILAGMGHLKARSRNAIRGFDDMTPEEIAAETRLPLELARLAKQREFDEPFRFTHDEEELAPLLYGWVYEIGLRHTRGGRFHHLHGDHDKGAAVKRLLRIYRRRHGRVETVGIGDSQNDLRMLLAVDRPYAVARPDGSHDHTLRCSVPRLACMPEPGPVGWAHVAREI